ncbi:MAG: energy transducer TonB [Pseudoxanthomonas suwonensis]|nr:MAG: energy transducer TonB [Pseudoxanthomonas suwonensis]
MTGQTIDVPHRRGWAWQAGALLLALGMTACGQQDTPPAGGETPSADPPAEAAVAAQPSAEDMSNSQLQQAAVAALREQRLYAPAGNNAIEYYVALREQQPGNAAIASALTDLMPYALIATEQSIAREDYVEAERLLGLMQQADDDAPALPRLRAQIDEGKLALAKRATDAEAETARQAELAKQREADQQRAQQEAAQRLAQQQEAERVAAAERAASEQRAAAERRAAEQRAAEERAAEERRAAEEAAARQRPTAPAAPVVRALSTPPPDYPSAALRDGRSGQVLVEFTVNTDGSVSNPRVVRAEPARVFDRAALAAVRRWRFQPVSDPVTTRRNISFEQPAQ